MAANNPNNVNAKTIQGPDPTGNQGYPVAVVPATGSDPFPIGPLPPGSEVVVTDIEDGAGDSVMDAANNAVRVNVVAGGGGGGGPVTIADGADVNQGATTDAANVTGAAGTMSGKLRGLLTILANVWDSVNSRLRVGAEQVGAWAVSISNFPASQSVLVTDIQDGAGNSIMAPLEDAARVVPATISGVATTQIGSTSWFVDGNGAGVRATLQVVPYRKNAFVSSGPGIANSEGHSVFQLLPSGARTTTQSTSLRQAVERRGCRVFLNVTAVPAAPGAGGLTVIIEARAPTSLTFQPILTAAVAVQAVGLYTYVVYPGQAAGGDTQFVSAHMGTNYRVRVGVGDAQSYTYSLDIDEIK